MQSCVIVQRIVALDMEGVVTPEIWIAVAERTGLSELRLTTRDEPDYQKLMNYRIKVLSENGIGLTLVREVIASLRPLEGARNFLEHLRQRYQVVILSDTFEQFAGHLMKELSYPHLLCHNLTIEMDSVVEFVPRIDDAKKRAVQSYQGLGYHVTAIGDSYNDLGMLQQADAGCLFRAATGLPEKYPMLGCLDAYHDLGNWIDAAVNA